MDGKEANKKIVILYLMNDFLDFRKVAITLAQLYIGLITIKSNYQ